MNVVEVLTEKFVEVWENWRLDLYSNKRLLHVLETGAETRWGKRT